MAAHGEDVAVIVPNYNKQKTLRACLESVYAQTHPPAEVVLVDDGSTDRSLEIARDFPCRLIRLPGNRGPAAARNVGVAASHAPLLFFVDSDTALWPDAIANAVRAYRDTPDCGIVQGIYDQEPLYDDGVVEAYRVALEHFERRQAVAAVLSCTLIPRHVFDETGGLDERLRDGEDFEFGNRLPACYRRVVTDTVVTRADEVERFWPCLWERFIRATTYSVIVMRARRLRRTGEGGRHPDVTGPAPRSRRPPPRIPSVLAALALLTLPFVPVMPWLLGPWLLLVVGFVAAFLTVNRAFLRFAHQLRGPGFAVFAAGMQVCYHAAFFLGAAAGVLRVGYETLRQRMDPPHPEISPASSVGVPE